MIFLINHERVIYEILELARLKISGILKVPPDAIRVSVEVEDGKLCPNVEIDPSQVEGVTPVQVRSVISTIYDRLKIDLRVRLTAMKRKRESYLPDMEEADGVAASAT